MNDGRDKVRRTVSKASIVAALDWLKKIKRGKVYRVSLLRPWWPVTVASFRTWRGWRDRVA